MKSLNGKNVTLSLTPLGAGDLIDRAVRLYRQNFFTLVRISSPPVIVSAIGTVFWTVGWREVFSTGRETAFAFYALLMTFGAVLWLIGSLLTLMIMGSAARNLVRHLLWHEPIAARETFRSLRERFFGLFFATLIIGFILFVALFTVYLVWSVFITFAVIGAAMLGNLSAILAIVAGLTVGFAGTVAAVWLFFLVAGRFAYVPQVMMVEGQGVFAAIGRSVSLASNNVWRLVALFLFTLFATGSALMILMLPLVFYAQTNGIPLFSFEPDAQPVWYSIALQVIWQLSLILLAPVWTLGLCLLYVDERVRQEAYDVELMAARFLGEMPPLAPNYINPLKPALVLEPPPPAFAAGQQSSNITTLGLS
jgi:hypothetical protein